MTVINGKRMPDGCSIQWRGDKPLLYVDCESMQYVCCFQSQRETGYDSCLYYEVYLGGAYVVAHGMSGRRK